MISILVTTYNGEKYILEQLESILNQNLRPDYIYIYDDCSTDNTISVLTSFIQTHNDANIILKQNKINKGYARNFLDALLEIEEDYVFLCDQDDVWSSSKISTFKNVLSEFDDSIPLLITSSYFVCDQDLKVCKKKHFRKKGFYEIKFKEFVKDCSYPGMTFCLNRALIQKIRAQINYERIFFHDYFISLIALSYGKMICIGKPMVLYRQHENNSIGIGGKENRERSHWRKALFQKKKETEMAGYYSNDSIFLVKKLRFINLRITWFEKRSFLSVFINLSKYIIFFSFKSWLADIYYSIKQ